MFTTLECQSWGKLCIPYFLGALGFYSSVESTFVSCLGRCFLMGKILINTRMLRDSSHVGIPLTRVDRGAQDISMWGLPKPCGCHMALVSFELRPMYPKPVHIEGLSIYYRGGGPFVMWSIRSPLHSLPYFLQLTNLVLSGSLERIHHP